jgi:3-phosphoglycerate kinase
MKYLSRVDFNVPIDKKTKEVRDARRIQESIPTIQYALAQGEIQCYQYVEKSKEGAKR